MGQIAHKKKTIMSNLRELRDYFNGRLEDERKTIATDIAVDKEKLSNLMSEVEAMLAVQAAKSRKV
jgi:hypothetical protein